MIPSAVVIPQPEEPRPRNGSASPPPDLKRKLSHSFDHDRKRPRIDTTTNTDSLNYDEAKHSPPAPVPTRDQTRSRTATSPTTRRSSTLDTGTAVEEKKRSRRLFGGLLGVVSGATARSNPAHKKRDEIEARARERLKKETKEQESERRRRRSEIEARREREQRRWDREGKELRWRNMRCTAGFLRTRAEPSIYYKPWELTPDEEKAVERQKKEVEEVIRREGGLAEDVSQGGQTVQAGSSRENGDQDGRQDETAKDNVLQPSPAPRQAHANGQLQDEGHDEKQDIEQPPPTDNGAVDMQDAKLDGNADQSASTSGPEDVVRDDDHHDGELVEGQEDDVIY